MLQLWPDLGCGATKRNCNKDVQHCKECDGIYKDHQEDIKVGLIGVMLGSV